MLPGHKRHNHPSLLLHKLEHTPISPSPGYKVFVLSRFPLISDHKKRTQRRPRCVEQIYRAGTRAGEAWATLAATAGDAHGFGDVVSLSLFFIYFGRAHELVTRYVYCQFTFIT